MELECKRKDESWHACQISLSEGNAAIIVAFENCIEKDEIESTEEGLARLRFRSAFLQGGECSRLTEGQFILALHDGSSSNLFYDAVVEKVSRVRHSNRLACRCTVSLKWLSAHLKNQKVTVPSTCIMRLSDRDIETHPVFKAFVASMNSRADMESQSPANSPLSENLFEVDLDGLLEKQVQEISIMAQGVDCSKNVILGFQKANQKGLEIKKKPHSNSGRRVTRSHGKQEIETPIRETTEKKPGSFSCLSPLAARAALASLVSTLPENGVTQKPKILQFTPDTSSAFPTSRLPKQAEKPPLTAKRVTVNSSSEKASSTNPVIPRRVTRSAVKIEVVDLTDGRREMEDIVSPIKTENKKRNRISPSASGATSASKFTDTVSDCEGEICQEVESQTVAKKKKIVSRKPPTRFSPRLATLG